MAQQNKTDFKTTKNSQYADNTSQAITESTHRTVFENVADSFISIEDEWIYAKKGPAPVVAASTANVTLSTDVENGDTLDGVSLSTGDRILLKDQSTASENGVWIVAASGSPTRASDFNSTDTAFAGSYVYVQQGTTNEKTIWSLTSPTSTVTIGTSNLTFENLIEATGNVTKVGTPVNNEIAVWTGDGTLEGESDLTYDGTTFTVTGDIAADNFSNGTYSPTITGITNISSASLVGGGKYSRSGAIVTVSVVVSITPTSSATFTEVDISLPISSNLGAVTDCIGTWHDQAGGNQEAGSIRGDATNDTARLVYYPKTTNAINAYCIFQYEII